MKKLVSLALAAAMTFMLTSVNPVPNFAQDSINLDKPLLMQFNDKLNKDTVYKDIRFLDEKGNEILGLDKAEKENVLVFHAGTAKKDGKIVTNGGRVLGVVALGDDIKTAVDKVYEDIKLIDFKDVYYRKDIAHRAFNRK